MSNQTKTKSERREEEKIKIKKKRQSGSTLAGQVNKTLVAKKFSKKKKVPK